MRKGGGCRERMGKKELQIYTLIGAAESGFAGIYRFVPCRK